MKRSPLHRIFLHRLSLNRLPTYRPLILTALLAVLGASALAATPNRFAGVAWQDPAGMEVSTSFLTSCPARCLTYRGSGNSDDWWPLIRVHEGVIGTAQTALNRLSAALKRDGSMLRVLQDGEQQVGAVKVRLLTLEIKDYADDSSPDFAVVLLLEQGGVTLPLELVALDREELAGPRFAALAALADTIKLSPEVIRKDVTARDAQFARLTKVITDGYANGERAQVYDSSDSGVRNEFNGGGLQLVAYRDTSTAAFLPGGVFLDRPGEPDYRAPDLRRMGGGELPLRWRGVSGGFEVMAPDGKVTLYKFGKVAGAQRSLTQNNETFWEIPRLGAADLTGIFSSISTSSSGGPMAPNNFAVYSRSDSDLELLPGGRYRSSNQSFTSVSASNVAGGTGQNTAAGGRWSYDPASYTLTLTPDGGGVRTGPTYTHTFAPDSRQKDSIDWTLLGDDRWWKNK
ncbi:hypothetical protein E7T06_20640 [Deinococcus sp. Arct2-2]|uniref:hypothetical protein n=1 Tax=Deinococcus sp. Arct2-2 TaxID=2568653 RepID=UPI0010A5494F|nr:hypothetical protein [Deinococcus sp. Arct2-2]THF66712.1 hypothetical protein E7T06_20640 [Deinococcus sp. Arct2-2]